MKVGIITLFHENYDYGAALQVYALQKAIMNLGHTAEIIDYEGKAESIDPLNNSITGKTKKKLYSIKTYGDLYNLVKHATPKEAYMHGIRTRKAGFQKFYSEQLKVSKYYNLGTIFFANNEFDAFVCMSDQVWWPGSFDPNYYLSFAIKGKKKISYAAGIGVRSLSKAASSKMIPLIEKLDAVSVREKEAVDLLNDQGLEASFTIDPILLWDGPFWNEIATTTKFEKGRYIFCYFIGENNSSRDIARKVASILKLPLVAIPGVSKIMPYDFKYADVNVTETSPDGFLGLIRDAALVITDSFHASCFSILFETPFVVTERFTAKDANLMDGQIYSLLKMFGLEKQLIKKGEAIDPEKLKSISPNREEYERLKLSSWKYLKNNLPEDWTSERITSIAPLGVYAAQNTDAEVRNNSSSGGVFYALAKKTLSTGGVVVACKMNSEGKAVHGVCHNMEELPEFMTSKYVQSEIGNCLIATGDELKAGREVMFVGAPCQAAGLIGYLKTKKIDTEKLLCVDFICHGVPSPYVWREYLNGVINGEWAQSITANFRHKLYGWRKFALFVKTEHQKQYLRIKNKDLYMRGFLKDIFLRPSCYRCRFKALHHDTDITLSDFWNFEQFESTIKDNDTGVSLVITQSKKGDKVLNELEEMAIDPMPFEVVSKANKTMFLSARMTDQRERFFKGYEAFKADYTKIDSMQVYLKKLIGDKPAETAKRIIKKLRRR